MNVLFAVVLAVFAAHLPRVGLVASHVCDMRTWRSADCHDVDCAWRVPFPFFFSPIRSMLRLCCEFFQSLLESAELAFQPDGLQFVTGSTFLDWCTWRCRLPRPDPSSGYIGTDAAEGSPRNAVQQATRRPLLCRASAPRVSFER